jgi:hypothetical protein
MSQLQLINFTLTLLIIIVILDALFILCCSYSWSNFDKVFNNKRIVTS